MPKIIIRADSPGEDAGLITLSERLAADNLESSHYAVQLIERIRWAAEDAQALEAHATEAHAPRAGLGRLRALDRADDHRSSNPEARVTG